MIPRIQLNPGYSMSRLIKGGWHLAGDHGTIDREQALDDMATFVEAGITSFDCADIYTDVERLIGAFREKYPDHAGKVQIQTKFVPDLADLDHVNAAYVERVIDRSLQRLRIERIDLVQFHWWNYDVPRYVETAMHLERLRTAGKIREIGVTNFDVPHLAELVEAGVPVVTHQLQYSLLDDRPVGAMTRYCKENGIGLLCYGTVAGGFLSERWLGQPEPVDGITNRSLIKYKLIIDDFGGWALFQRLLQVLSAVAERHRVEIATVASRAILDRDNVLAAIVGATSARHLPAHQKIGGLQLDATDMTAIDEVLHQRKGPNGDVYTLERDITGTHGRIMKYDLNK